MPVDKGDEGQGLPFSHYPLFVLIFFQIGANSGIQSKKVVNVLPPFYESSRGSCPQVSASMGAVDIVILPELCGTHNLSCYVMPTVEHVDMHIPAEPFQRMLLKQGRGAG